MSGSDERAREREAWLAKVYSAGGDSARLREYYYAWAEDYDSDLAAFGYVNPGVMAGLVGRHVAGLDARILDAGAGTGIIGNVLAIVGYRRLTGIDLSQGMLDRAARLNAYEALHRMELGQPLGFPDDAFDATLAAGVLTIGHAPPESLDELLRVTRPGGPLIFSVTEGAYHDGGFGAKMDALEHAGAWSRIEATQPYIPLPGVPPEPGHASRMYVYEAA